MNAPTLDSGFMAVPAVLTDVVGSAVGLYLYSAFFANPTDDPLPITVTDAAGNQIIPAKQVPPHDTYSENWALKPTDGVKWVGPGLYGQIWGHTSWPL